LYLASRRNVSGTNGDALLLGVAAALEPLSKVRKDGRALRIVAKRRARVVDTLREKWAAIARDVRFMHRALGQQPVPRVIRGDGRNPIEAGVKPASVDLILTSPPYPNTIDYTEVYKLELWLLGLVESTDEFLQLRRGTFRSHPTTLPADPSEDFMCAIGRGRLRTILTPLLKRTSTSTHRWRHRLLVGYFSDTWDALSAHFQCLRKGGYAVYVVGNSLHGGISAPYLIPTDLILSLMAERLGFTVHKTLIARSLPRRLSGNHFLRDSVVILKKA
jgi:hypothetical protein